MSHEIPKSSARATSMEIPDGELLLIPELFSHQESERLLHELLAGVRWDQKVIRIYGREVASPRLTAWYGDPGAVYAYSGITLDPLPWIRPIAEVKQRIEAQAGCIFNGVLVNQYRDGLDSMGWHSDDERELGEEPVIGSVSFGADRRFLLRHRERKDLEVLEFPLGGGAGLVMRGATQSHWGHQVPKTGGKGGIRVNLTYRRILTSHQ